jgi:hypothetical protein
MTDLLDAKRLGSLHDLVPEAATVGFLWNPPLRRLPKTKCLTPRRRHARLA